MTASLSPEEVVIAQCRARLARIDDELAWLNTIRDSLVAEQDRLALAIEAAKDPSVLNRGKGRAT
jgi:hypothetical protein